MIALGLFLAIHAKQSKADVIRKVRAQLEIAASYLGDYSARPPAFTTDKADSMYVLRGEADIQVVEIALRFYAKGQVKIDAVNRAIDQLNRDIEDIPPSQTENVVPHGKRI